MDLDFTPTRNVVQRLASPMRGMITPERVAAYTGMSPAQIRAGTRIASAMYRRYKTKKTTWAAQQRRFARVNTKFGIGQPISSAYAKKTIMANGTPLQEDTRILYFYDLTDIIPASDVTADRNAINSRQRGIVNLSGFSLNWIMKNLAGTPLTVNIAFVAPRNSVSLSASGFFRDYTTSRDVDFSTGLNNNQIHTYPISTDKFTILKHDRFFLGATPGINATWTTESNNYKRRKYWVPLKRQIRFNDDSSTFAEQHVYCCYWFDYTMALAMSDPQLNKIDHGMRLVTYWNEAKG